jgi:hypothetical protein
VPFNDDETQRVLSKLVSSEHRAWGKKSSTEHGAQGTGEETVYLIYFKIEKTFYL